MALGLCCWAAVKAHSRCSMSALAIKNRTRPVLDWISLAGGALGHQGCPWTSSHPPGGSRPSLLRGRLSVGFGGRRNTFCHTFGYPSSPLPFCLIAPLSAVGETRGRSQVGGQLLQNSRGCQLKLPVALCSEEIELFVLLLFSTLLHVLALCGHGSGGGKHKSSLSELRREGLEPKPLRVTESTGNVSHSRGRV